MQRKLFRQLTTIIIALLIPILPFVIIGELPGEQWLSSTDENAALFAVTGATLLVCDILLPVASSVVGTLIGARLGFLPGVATIWIALMTGQAIGYAIGRLALRRLQGGLPEMTTGWMVFCSRPVPILAEAMSFAAGASGMTALRFLSVCGAGNLVYACLLAGNGAALVPGALLGPGIILPMLLPIVLWMIWRLLARAPGRQVGPDGHERA